MIIKTSLQYNTDSGIIREFKTTVISMLRAQTETTENRLKQISNANRDRPTLGRIKIKQNLKKYTVTEVKNAFYGLIRRIYTAKKRISMVEHTSQTEVQREKKDEKSRTRIQQLWDNYKWYK